MSKQWWSSRSMFMAQGGCLAVLFAWSVHHAPGETGRVDRLTSEAKIAAAAPKLSPRDVVIDNSDDTAANRAPAEADARFVGPPPVRFRTEHPPAGSLNLRPLELRSSIREQSAPWQPVHPRNPPQRLPEGPRSQYEVNGATVYNAPPPEAD